MTGTEAMRLYGARAKTAADERHAAVRAAKAARRIRRRESK